MAFTIDRRALLIGAAATAAAAATESLARPLSRAGKARELPLFFADLEQRTFRFFWERANPKNGLIPDRWPTPSFSSIAAVGFGLSAYVIGAERGWITRAEARDRTLLTLRFLSGLPMGEAPQGVAGYRGFFYHFLNMETGLRHARTELSTVDTGLLHLGALHAAAWFDRPEEAELRNLAYSLVDRAEWDWFQRENMAIPMGWHPESGFIARNWEGYNEGKLVYVLALGSAAHPARDGSWAAWTATYGDFWRGAAARRWLAFAPMFGHQYSEMWIDFRGIRDEPMRRAGFDYFENSRRATLAQHAYATANPMGWTGYDDRIWGLTACDGPGHFELRHEGHAARFAGYAARGPIAEPDGFDDGTIAPTAMLGSLPFAPEICIPSVLTMQARHGRRIYGQYGFLDSFNPSFRDTNVRVATGTVDAQSGWVATDYLGIDQGPIVGMLANYRSESIWRATRRSPNIIRGLQRAGFTGGWLDQAAVQGAT